MMTLSQFDATMQHRGWVILPAVVPQSLIDAMLIDMDLARTICRLHQERNGVAENTVGTVHHLPSIPGLTSFLTFLENNPAHDYIERFLRGKYVLQSLGGNFNDPGRTYASEIHRDIRTYQEMPLVINTLVMLDEFKVSNGATWMMRHGHKHREKPTKDHFNTLAEQAIGPAGSIVLFDSNLWHAAGQNFTDQPRRSITPMFCRPFVKPGLDYCRAIGYGNVAQMSPRLQQVLGYHARMPANLDEWYQVPEKRYYQGSQG